MAPEPTVPLEGSAFLDFRPGFNGPVVIFIANDLWPLTVFGPYIDLALAGGVLHPYMLAGGAALGNLMEGTEFVSAPFQLADLQMDEKGPAAFVTAGEGTTRRLELAARTVFPHVPMIAIAPGGVLNGLIKAFRDHDLPLPERHATSKDPATNMEILMEIVSEGIRRIGACLTP